MDSARRKRGVYSFKVDIFQPPSIHPCGRGSCRYDSFTLERSVDIGGSGCMYSEGLVWCVDCPNRMEIIMCSFEEWIDNDLLEGCGL